MKGYRYKTVTQYSGSMRVLAKVRANPGGIGPGPSNWTDITLTSHHLSTSGLSTDNIRICLNALVRVPCNYPSTDIPQLTEIVLDEDLLSPEEDFRFSLFLSSLYLFLS